MLRQVAKRAAQASRAACFGGLFGQKHPQCNGMVVRDFRRRLRLVGTPELAWVWCCATEAHDLETVCLQGLEPTYSQARSFFALSLEFSDEVSAGKVSWGAVARQR